jgi:hypothetical protein
MDFWRVLTTEEVWATEGSAWIVDKPSITLQQTASSVEPGFPLNEGQNKILNGGFRLDVAA